MSEQQQKPAPPPPREQIAMHMVRTSGRAISQARGLANGLSEEAVARVVAVISSKGDVVAAIDAELNAIADVEIKRQEEAAAARKLAEKAAAEHTAEPAAE